MKSGCCRARRAMSGGGGVMKGCIGWLSVAASFLLICSATQVSALTQKDFHDHVSVEVVSFQSENDCDAIDSYNGVYPRLRCRHDDNTYHELVVDIFFGQGRAGEEKELESSMLNHNMFEFHEAEIAMKVTSEFKNLAVLKTPESCLSPADGHCMLLNQGEAKLRITTEVLSWKHSIHATPTYEVPYDYHAAARVVEGGLDELDDAVGGIGGVEGIDCFLVEEYIEPEDLFLTGERCPVLACPCGVYNEGNVTLPNRTILAEVSGLMPSCGVFPIEENAAAAHYSAKFEFIHKNPEQTREIVYEVEFTRSDAGRTMDVVDVTGTLQVILDIVKDPSRYVKTPYVLDGAVVICNWDGKYVWGGPDGLGYQNTTLPNVFPIPLLESGIPDMQFTTAAWYYVDDYALFDEFQPGSVGQVGMSMLDLATQVNELLPGFFDKESPEDSRCCVELSTEHEMMQFITKRALPRHTPASVLESFIAKDLNYEGLPGVSYAPSLSRFRSGHPGYKSSLINRHNVIRPLLDYRLFANDRMMHPEANVNATQNLEKRYSLRRPFKTADTMPHDVKTEDHGGPAIPEVRVRAAVLISDRVLTGRFQLDKTFIPSTFSPKDDHDHSLSCKVSPASQRIEVQGWLCNAASTVQVNQTNMTANLKCVMPKESRRRMPDGAPVSFRVPRDVVLNELLRNRGCNDIALNVRPAQVITQEHMKVDHYIGGKCTLQVFYNVKLADVNTKSKRRGGSGSISVLVGEHDIPPCLNVDFEGDIDPEKIIKDATFVGGRIPDQCDHSWDFKCWVGDRNQPDEDMGGVIFIIILLALIGAAVLLLVGHAIYDIYSTDKGNKEKAADALDKYRARDAISVQ